MHHDAGDKVGPDRVDHAQVSIDRTDRAEHGPLSIASETVEDEMKNALSATTLRQIEAGEQEAPKAEPERGRPRQRRVGSSATSASRPIIAKRNWVAAWRRTSTMTLATPSAAGTPVKRQQPRANDIAADLRHRQKHIDRLSNEPQGSTCSK